MTSVHCRARERGGQSESIVIEVILVRGISMNADSDGAREWFSLSSAVGWADLNDVGEFHVKKASEDACDVGDHNEEGSYTPQHCA